MDIQDTIPYVVKKPQSCAPEDGPKIWPKHVELILEINKTVIVASRWFLYYLTSKISVATENTAV